MRLPLVLILLTLAGAAAAQDLPPELRAATEAELAACRAAGGEPAVTEAYATAAELNGDGAEDWVLDLAGLDCAGAGGVFCGAAGCPVSVWLSGTGGHLAAWRGHARGWRLEDGAVVVERQGAFCPAEIPAACEERLAFADQDGDRGASPAAEAQPSLAGEAEPEPPPEGWSLRAVSGRTPVAVGTGTGAIDSIAAFCLAGQPWLAIDFAAEPAGEASRIGFAFSERDLTAEARREESAGGAYVIALADQPLAALLAGRDASVPVTLDGAAQGALSLKGSTRAIGAALQSCR
jgi:hypothetical protein